MHLSLLLICSLVGPSTTLSVPYNSTILQLPSHLPPASSTDIASSTADEWPPPPYTINNGSLAIVFQRYGRNASPELRFEICKAIEDLGEYFGHKKRSFKHEIHQDGGIVDFHMGFTSKTPVTGENVQQALQVMHNIYSDEDWDLTEVTSAQLVVTQGWVQAGAFQILFTEV